MNAEEAVRLAIDYGRRAAAEEEARNLSEAFRLYKQALFLYFVAAKEIRAESSGYLQRTHEFIRFLGARAGSAECAPRSSSPAPSSSGAAQQQRLITRSSSLSLCQPSHGYEEHKAFHTSGVVVLGEAQVRWSDVFGLEALKRALMLNVVYPVKHPSLFENGRPLSSLVLYGPTGCGKSHVGKALATEFNDSTFFYVMCQHFASKCVVGNENLTVRTLFEMVLNHAPSVLFLDDLDALSGTGVSGETSGFLYRVKADFLSLLEGILFKQKVTVIGATKSPWAVDPALARVFRKWVYVPLPSDETRQLMIISGLKDSRHQLSDADLTRLVEMTEGFTCEDLTLLQREARIEVKQKLKAATHFVKVEGYRRPGSPSRTGDFLTPCAPDTPGAIQLSWKEIPKEALLEPELTLKEFEASLLRFHASVTSSELDKLDAFRTNQESNLHSVLKVDMRPFKDGQVQNDDPDASAEV
ncbi:vacuolar protein sorting-associated protein 4B-like [Haemaphysalis longicornis]